MRREAKLSCGSAGCVQLTSFNQAGRHQIEHTWDRKWNLWHISDATDKCFETCYNEKAFLNMLNKISTLFKGLIKEIQI